MSRRPMFPGRPDDADDLTSEQFERLLQHIIREPRPPMKEFIVVTHDGLGQVQRAFQHRNVRGYVQQLRIGEAEGVTFLRFLVEARHASKVLRALDALGYEMNKALEVDL